ncbi:MAG TPA: SpoIIE family protein phosphatase, partial [Solirubrobacteraceae bacterium]|nr:SpoIIE family protein phosphatase [Solirubrobacteraceae bacterium]
TYWNPAAERMFGLSASRAAGRPVAELIIPERLREAHTAGLRRLVGTGEGRMLDRRIELTGLRSDGTEFPVEMTVSALREGSAWTFIAFLQDISARRESEREHERLIAELRRALHGSERRFDAIVGGLTDPVTIRDRNDRIVYANKAALAHLGFASTEDLRATAPEQIMADYLVLDKNGNEISMDQIPSVRLLRGESQEPLVIRTINRHSGDERWNLLKASPLLDAAGEVEATILVIEDVTEQQRSERRAEFLAQASEVLASSLDYQQTLRNVAQLAVPGIVDWCAVDLLDGDGDRMTVAVAHADPARLELAEQLRAYEPEQLDPSRGLGRALRTGETVWYPEIPDEMLVAQAADARHLELLRAVGFRSAAVVPMRIGQRSLGAMTLVSAESGRTLDRLDVALAEEIAARAAVAIENARVYSERSRIAHTLQQSLLPEQLPAIPGYELASVYIPAFESTEVGGDFYDAWEAGSGWIIAIGDVTGKGVEAAALTSLVRHTLRAVSEFVSSPAELLSHLDRVLKKHSVRSICTALCLRLDASGITLAVGGHPLPLRVGPRGAETVGDHGPLLGAFPDADWQDVAVELEAGCTLLAYTDGVTDAVGPDGGRYGLQRLCATLADCHAVSAGEMIEALRRALSEFQTRQNADDTAALALRRLTPNEPVGRERRAHSARSRRVPAAAWIAAARSPNSASMADATRHTPDAGAPVVHGTVE